MRPLTRDEKEAILFCCIITMTGTFYVMELDSIRTNRALREAAHATRTAAHHQLALQKLQANAEYARRNRRWYRRLGRWLGLVDGGYP